MSTHKGLIAGTLRPTLGDFLEWVLWNVWQWHVGGTEEFFKEFVHGHRTNPMTIHLPSKLASNLFEIFGLGREGQVWAVLLFSRSRFAGEISCVRYDSVLGLRSVLVLVSIRHVKERAVKKY